MKLHQFRRCCALAFLGAGLLLLLAGAGRTFGFRSLGQIAGQPHAAEGGIGGTDINLITGGETHPNITQNNSVAWGHADTVVVAYNDKRDIDVGNSAYGCSVSVSTDAGATFRRLTASEFPAVCVGNPSIFYSRRAAKWFFSCRVSGCGFGGISQMESTNGLQWVSSGCLATSNPSQVFLDHSTWVDNNLQSPFYGRQYAAFNDTLASLRIQSTFSTDDGVTWSSLRSVKASATEERLVKFTGSLGTDGTIFVQTVYEGINPQLGARQNMYIYRSENGGNTWREIIQGQNFFVASYFGPGRVACTDSPSRGCIYSSGYWWDAGWGQAAVGPNNVVHYVFSAWPDENNDPGNIYYIRSTNNGTSWSNRVRLNTDSTLRAQWNPSLAVNAQGLAVVSWYDERNTTDNSLERYGRVSLDNGVTWAPDMPVSDVVFPTPLRPDTSSEVGRHNHAMFSNDGFGGDAYVTWVDGRVAIKGSPQQDIFFDKVELIPPAFFVVTTLADHDDGTCNSTDCTLREAITAANAHPAANFISFTPGLTGTIQLGSALPTLSERMRITGPGANLLEVRRNTGGNYRIFTISDDDPSSGPTVTLSGLKISNGNLTGAGNYGGAILNDHASVNLIRCELTGNATAQRGGAVYSNGSNVGAIFTATDTTFSGNSANFSGGAIYNQGSDGDATMTLTNCTISDNSVPNGFGGAILNSGKLVMRNNTLNANSASTGGGGIYNTALGTGEGNLDIANTILKTGSSGENLRNDSGVVVSEGNNLSSDSGNGLLTGPGDQVTTDPQFDPAGLANNGGATRTIALLSGSPAINTGNDSLAPLVDQRAYARSGTSDKGAFEFAGAVPAAPTVVSAVSRLTHGFAGTFDINLPLTGTPGLECRSATNYQVVVTFAGPVTLDSVSVTGGASPQNFSVSGSEVTLTLAPDSASGKRLIITLQNVIVGSTSGNVAIPMNLLVGDTGGNGSVNSSDIGQTKAASGQAVTGSNFRLDVTVSGGNINASDISLVKSRSGSNLPSP